MSPGAGSDGPPVLVVWGLTDPRSMREIVWPAFLESTGLVATLDYRQDVDMGRLLDALAGAAPGSRPDVAIIANPHPFHSAGLLAVTDDIDTRGLPDAWTDGERRAVPLYVQPIVFVYNAHYALPPERWPDIVQDRWRDRLVFEAAAQMLTTGPALAELRSETGPDAWQAWLAALNAVRPRQVADNERAVLEIATGSRWGGLSNWNVARRVRPGSPVRHVFLDPTPCIPGFGAVVEGAASPDLARSLLRWLASADGQRAYAATGRIPAAPPADSPITIETVVPVRSLVGTADWVRDPEPWVAIYEATIPVDGMVKAGKLRA